MFLLAGPALAQVHERDGDAVVLVGTYGDWDVRTYDMGNGERRCAARAIHPQLIQGNLFWIFNTGNRDKLPEGYLSIDSGLLGNGARWELEIDGGDSYPLAPSIDGNAYNLPEETTALLAELRAHWRMTLVVSASDGTRQEVPVSLAGFSRAVDTARRECGF